MGRKRKSKFDPYIERIKEWCSMGMTVKEMTDVLNVISEDEEFYDQGVYAYIYSHQLRYAPAYNRRICDMCEHCHTYINTNGNEGRVCDKSWRTISNNVSHSPKWCEYEERTD